MTALVEGRGLALVRGGRLLFDGFDISDRPKVSVVTMTVYDQTFDEFGVRAAFAPQSLARIVAEVLSDAGRTMLKTAETEKYPHVTYFFNGGVEQPYPCEHRVMVPSPKVAILCGVSAISSGREGRVPSCRIAQILPVS